MNYSVRRILISGCTAAAIAMTAVQSAPAQEVTATESLEIPEDATVLGELDPNKRRATAKVNGEIITGTDVDQRVALIVLANEGVQIPEDELQRLRVRVLRDLIDETLKVQEAAAQDMAVTPQEVDEYYLRYAAQRFGRTPEQLDAYLRAAGSSPASLKAQIEGELAWDRLLQRNVQPFVNVSADEVQELYDRLQASRGTPEYRLAEIYLSSTPATHQAVGENARKIVEQLRDEGGNFVAYARQFSEASTAAVGGDLGWIRLEQLQNPTLETVARNMEPGQLVGPIEIPGGFSILYLQDKRQVGMADPRDAVLSLKQISLKIPAGLGEAEAKAKVEGFAQMLDKVRGCGEADAASAAIGAQVVNNDEMPVRALPDAFQQLMLKLNIGETTPLFGDPKEEVRVLMLCGRDDPAPDAGPNYDQLMAQLEDERVGKRAERYLRDLRRDAVVEYN